MYNFDVSYFIDGVGLRLKYNIYERRTGSWCDGDSFTFNMSLDNVVYSFFIHDVISIVECVLKRHTAMK